MGGEFCNNIFKRFLKVNNIEMYSTYNEGKSVAAGRFIRSLKKKRLLSTWQLFFFCFFFDVSDNIVNKHNNTVHRSIKMKPVNVTSDSYAEYNGDSNVTRPKFKVCDHVRISK